MRKQIIYLSLIFFCASVLHAQNDPCTAIGVDLTDALQCPHTMTDYTVTESDPTDGFEDPGCGLDGTRAIAAVTPSPGPITISGSMPLPQVRLLHKHVKMVPPVKI